MEQAVRSPHVVTALNLSMAPLLRLRLPGGPDSPHAPRSIRAATVAPTRVDISLECRTRRQPISRQRRLFAHPPIRTTEHDARRAAEVPSLPSPASLGFSSSLESGSLLLRFPYACLLLRPICNLNISFPHGFGARLLVVGPLSIE